jgi:cytochrome c
MRFRNAVFRVGQTGAEGLRGAGLVIAVAVLAAVLVTPALLVRAAQQRSETRAIAVAMTSGDPERAPALMTRYGCGGCHTISGIPGADGKVGPALKDLRGRVYVASSTRNTADNLIGFIVDPQRFSPRSAMPKTGITEAEARDVAAYLYAE